jgi:cytochrome P450
MPVGGLRDTRDGDPFPYYAALHEQGPVAWDDTMGAWVVSGYEACKEVLRKDVVTLRHGDADNLTTVSGISGSTRGLKFLVGREQRLLHTWWMKAFNPQRMAEYRPTLVQPMVNRTIDRIIEKGRAELFSEVAARIPPRAVAAALSLPWDDDAWIGNVKALLDRVARYYDLRFVQDEEVIADATVASDELNAIMMPFIDERRSGSGGDMISELWRYGAEMIDDWSEVDVIGHIRTMFLGGTDTTNLGISNALYLLLSDPELAERLRRGGEPVVADFVEEALRVFGPVHFRARKANEDFELAGVHIRKNDNVIPLLAGADSDPAKYRCPHAVDLDRPAPRDHVAFNFGPRACVGAALARAELQETVSSVLRRMPDIRFDPEAPPPSFGGFALRCWAPLHVLFTPGPQVVASRRTSPATADLVGGER